MNFLKMGAALSLVAAFGLVACDDSSSGDDNKTNDPNTISCKVTNDENPLTIETIKGEISSTTTLSNDNGIFSMKVEFNKDVPESECTSYEDQYSEYFDVKCSGNTITAKSAEKVKDEFFDIYGEVLKADCEKINGKKLDDKDIDKAKEKVEAGMKCDTDGEEKEVSSDEVSSEDGTTASAKVTLVCKDGKWALKDAEVNTSKGETATDDEDGTNTGDNEGEENPSTEETEE